MTDLEDRYRDLLGALWLYVDWPYVTRQLPTEQKDLFADAVDATSDGPVADRWWSQWPCCAVCGSPCRPRLDGAWVDIRGNAGQPTAVNWAGIGPTPPHMHIREVST